MALKTDYKEDILASGNTKRRYNMITNDDGTVSFEDVTKYAQTGDSFGAGDANSANEILNRLDNTVHVLKIGYCEIHDTGSVMTDYDELIDVPSGTVSVIPFFDYISMDSPSKSSLTGVYHTVKNGKHYLASSGSNASWQVAYICIDKARG